MPSKPPTHRPRQLPVTDARPSAASRGYDARWRRLRLLVLRARPICAHCQRESAVHVDHITPLAQGGTDDLANLQGLCPSCHSRKTAVEDGGFGRRRKEVWG